MGECETLIRRREMLLEDISMMSHEVEKIDQRLDFLAADIQACYFHDRTNRGFIQINPSKIVF